MITYRIGVPNHKSPLTFTPYFLHSSHVGLPAVTHSCPDPSVFPPFLKVSLRDLCFPPWISSGLYSNNSFWKKRVVAVSTISSFSPIQYPSSNFFFLSRTSQCLMYSITLFMVYQPSTRIILTGKGIVFMLCSLLYPPAANIMLYTVSVQLVFVE